MSVKKQQVAQAKAVLLLAIAKQEIELDEPNVQKKLAQLDEALFAQMNVIGIASRKRLGWYHWVRHPIAAYRLKKAQEMIERDVLPNDMRPFLVTLGKTLSTLDFDLAMPCSLYLRIKDKLTLHSLPIWQVKLLLGLPCVHIEQIGLAAPLKNEKAKLPWHHPGSKVLLDWHGLRILKVHIFFRALLGLLCTYALICALFSFGELFRYITLGVPVTGHLFGLIVASIIYLLLSAILTAYTHTGGKRLLSLFQ